MRYIIRKFVDAKTVQEAMSKEQNTPVHDCYLKDGEQPKSENEGCSAIGFQIPIDDYWRSDEVIAGRKK
jgi:hypothetical protein